jgi:hypothetical protein
MLLWNQICGPESVQMGLANGVVGRAIGLLFEADEPPVREGRDPTYSAPCLPRGMFVYVPTATVTPLPYLDASLLVLANNDPTKIILVRPNISNWTRTPLGAINFHCHQRTL